MYCFVFFSIYFYLLFFFSSPKIFLSAKGQKPSPENQFHNGSFGVSTNLGHFVPFTLDISIFHPQFLDAVLIWLNTYISFLYFAIKLLIIFHIILFRKV